MTASAPGPPRPSRAEAPADGDAGAEARDAARRNFIREKIDADLAAGRHESVVTRFPPEPNGFLHIGHAKAVCLNFTIAEDYGGACHLRFDDTNPVTEDTAYVDAIVEDIAWLGFRWAGEVRFASDYFEAMYGFAVELIEKGLAYVDDLSPDEIREYRGTPYEPGRDSPYRTRAVDENLELFARMRAGEFPDGARVLRAKIDMASPNLLMRDPTLYRIKHATHHRTGDTWCIYPMYDFAHCLEDAIEGVTHSLCTLEFQDNRALYDWILDHVSAPSRPRQTEFARLALEYTVVAKRKLRRLVEEGRVDGWDDPRMPTLAGLRRRGVTPEAIRAFCAMIGVAKTDSFVDIGKLEYCIRDDLNTRAPRVMGVLRPLRLVVTDFPAGRVDELDAPYWPPDVGKPGTRKVPFARELVIERDDFAEDPPRGWRRLAPGREVRLRYGYVVRCDEVIKDEHGEVVEVRCTHDPATRGGEVPDGRKVSGTIHWVAREHAVAARVRLYDRLFAVPRPGADADVDFVEELNPDSLVEIDDARLEPSLAEAAPGDRFQLERLGYFAVEAVEPDTGAPVLNRIVTLRDSWARKGGAEPAAARAAAGAAGRRDRAPAPAAPAVDPSQQRDRVREEHPDLAALHRRCLDELGVAEGDADILTGDPALAAFFERAVDGHAAPALLAKWIVNEVLGALDGRSPADAGIDPAHVAELVTLLHEGALAGPAAKEVLAEMIETRAAPRAIVDRRGLAAVRDTSALDALIDEVLAAHAEPLARYRDGETKLFGFLMGELMKASRGAADPKVAKERLRARLG